MESGWRNELFRLLEPVGGKKKHDCAVVIPCADSKELLMRHFKRLERQNYMGFDVLLISRKKPKLKSSLNIIFCREKYPLGSSGGFGIGQALAYSLGYEYVINSDADATPISKNLVGHLVETARSSGKAVFPRSVQYEGYPIGGHVINQYGICPRNLLKEFGFLYFRLFKGSEDVDYVERLLMEGKVILDNSVLVRHKSHIFDFISLLKFRGNKYIYYKKGEMLVQILLTSYSIRHTRLLHAAKHFSAALLAAVKTQLFYSQYPDILQPVLCQAMHLDMSKTSPGRTSLIKEVKEAGNPAKLSVFGEKSASGVVFSAGSAHLPLLRALFSKGGHFLPTRRFIDEHGGLLPLLLLAKPVKYSDGIAYSSGLSHWQATANIIKTTALIPYFFLSIAFSVLKASKLDYPITAENLKKNLEEFLVYVKKLDAAGKKGRT